MLIEQFVEPCKKIVEVKTPDGEGGTYTTYKEGETLSLAIVKDKDIDTFIAESAQATETYTITYFEGNLSYHDIIKNSNNSYFLIVSDSSYSSPPRCASFNFKQVKAVKHVI